MSDKKTVVIALGYFDSVHKGHRAVISAAKALAVDLGVSTAVFSFAENLRKALGTGDKTVYSAAERRQILKVMGVDEVYFAPVTKEFLALDKKEFLDLLSDKYDVAGYVCGRDYTFGKLGAGNVEYLKEYALSHGREVVVCEDTVFGGEKISTTRIKKLLAAGLVKEANLLLGRRYSVTGRVFADRKVGSKLGFPTVNLKLDLDKACLKDGVYAGSITVDRKKHRALINYGSRPTFSLDEKLVEAHILDFNGDLYGKKLTIYFDSFMRDIVRFENPDGLRDRLNKDVREIRSGLYD